LLADLIEVAGADRWMTIDLHAQQIQGFYKIPGDSLTAFHIQVDYFLQKDLDAVVVTPDLGFAKRGRNFAAELNLPLAFVEKRRVGNRNDREALSLIGTVADKDVIIVDDLVDTAGSIQEAVQLIKSKGAKDVYITFTHPVLSDPAIERLRSLPITEIVTTDTIPIPLEKMLPNMTILSVCELLGEVIIRSHEGRSVGELFNE
jgi:ribose-phosphate pyrophosphokinase